MLIAIFGGVLLLGVGANFHGLFNLDELENSQYSVSISDIPITLDQAEGDSLAENIVIMMNKFGQKYQCQLPLQATSDEPEGSGGSGKEPEPEIDVGALLKDLHSSPCLVRTKDWWTYQVCFGREISQYHVENDKPVGEVMSLGVFNSDRENVDKSVTYYPEWYTNGTKCDLTGRGRETELRFVCNEKAIREFIGDIFEPKSCEYSIVIHTDKICNVPQFKPTPDSEPLDINCKPILMKEQMEKYERYAKLKARKLQLKKMRVRQEQEKFLRLMSAGSNPLKAIPGFGDENINKLVKEIGAFMQSSLDSTSSEPAVKVIDMKGDLTASIPNKDHVTATQKSGHHDKDKKSGEGWNLVHDAKKASEENLRTKVSDLENRLSAAQNFVSYNLNTRLLSIYQGMDKAQANDDHAKFDLLRSEKLEVEAELKKHQDEIETLKKELDATKGDLIQKELSNMVQGKEKTKGETLKPEETDKVKKMVRDEFPSIVKDAMKELGIQDEEMDAMDDTMAAMEDELNILMKKIQGAAESPSLKRDGKKSVKKDLRDDDEPDEAQETLDTIQEAVERLKKMESKLDDVEEGLKEKKEKIFKDVEKAKKSGKDLEKLFGDSEDDTEDFDVESKMFLNSLETKLKSNIEKLGLDKLNLDTPVEVKVVATNVPVGDDDMESMDKSYYDGILHNIMTGNDKGYQDIQNQFAADKNYKFNVDDSEYQRLADDVDKLELKVGLQDDDGDDTNDDGDFNDNDDSDLYDVVENDNEEDDLIFDDGEEEEESMSSLVDELLGAPDPRARPSSKQSNTDDIQDNEDDFIVMDSNEDDLYGGANQDATENHDEL